jgi:adenosyl cobinamide kinase/adenosyl cobinamide phosphate guanylyltransferase
MTSQNYSRLNHHTGYSAILINKLKSIILMPHRKEQPITSTEKTATPRLVLIIGGARSGKSSFAEQLAASSERPVAFIATATADDDEMRERIARHRASRPRQWHTLEEPLDLSGAIRRASALADVLLLDCVTLWLGNVLSQASKQHESAPIHPANADKSINRLSTVDPDLSRGERSEVS